LSRFTIHFILSVVERNCSYVCFALGDKCKNSIINDCSLINAGIASDSISQNMSPTGNFPSCSFRSRSFSARDGPSSIIGDRSIFVPVRLMLADRTAESAPCDSLAMENINSRSSDVALLPDAFHWLTNPRKSSLYDRPAGERYNCLMSA